jgi:hypothetical protein
MALVVNDRVKETSTTTGTGTFTLAGAVTGFETFSSAIGNTNTTYYSIVIQLTKITTLKVHVLLLLVLKTNSQLHTHQKLV